MIHKDLTLLYYTSNTISDYFMKNIQDQIIRAVGDTPIVSVSQKPIQFGTNICVGDIGRSAYNIYKQVLVAAKAATTEFVATAEDDVLYPQEHFEYRPTGDIFAYDINKWSIYTWTQPPIFSQKERTNMSSLICRREPLIKTLEERFLKWPDPDKIPHSYFGEPGRFELHLGISGVVKERIKTKFPHVMFSCKESLAFGHLGTRKAHSKVRVTELAPWGQAEDVLKLYQKI
jgi:hypothetical protein